VNLRGEDSVRTRAEFSRFVGGLPTNLKVMMARSSIANFSANVNPYSSLYVIALGATASQLGLLNSASLALSSLVTLLTGWISDRQDRKTIYLAGALAGVLVPLLYAAAPGWTWLVPAFVLYGLSDGLVAPSWQAMYANSVGNRRRGRVYGLANVFILAPILFAGIVGGEIVSRSGGLIAAGIRPVYWLQVFLLAGAWILVWRGLRIQGRSRPGGLTPGRMLSDYREVLRKPGVRSWVLMKSLGSVSIGMAGPFWMVYAAMVHGASAMTIAYMVTARTLTQILLSPFSGRLVDAVGRKKMIISGRVVMYAGTAVFLIWGSGPLLILAWVLMGVNDSTGIAWSAEEAELVPPGQRSRITALSHGAFNALAVPASILGGYLYEFVSPLAPFVVMALIDGLVRMPIIHLLVPESSTMTHEGDGEDAAAYSME
jgi:MFS family permease